MDGDINTAAWLTNTDPARVYCVANPNDSDTGVMEMRRMGWVVELARKDGPRIVGGDVSADGTALEYKGGYVMSRPKEVHEAYLRQVASVADTRAKAIGQPGGIDGVRGVPGRLAEFAHDPREYVERG